MYAHYFIQNRKFTMEERQQIISELKDFFDRMPPTIRSYSSGGYYRYYEVDWHTVQFDTNKIHFEVTRPSEYTGHLGDNLVIDFENPVLNESVQINTLRMPFDMIVQIVFIVINNIVHDAFYYTSDGTVDDWKWSRNTLNKIVNKKYKLLYLDVAKQDWERDFAITEVLNSDKFSYVDGKRYINNDGDIYDVLTTDELYNACVNHVAEVVPTYLLNSVDVDGFYKDTVKRLYDGSDVYLSPVGCGFVTEIEGKEYFILKK